MKRILLVDDEPWLAEGLAAALESRGFACLRATDMTEGVRALAGQDICAVVTDIMMPPGAAFPKIDSNEAGFHLIEYIRKRWPKLPIVCLSVIANQAKLVVLKRKGIRYLRKGETPLSTAVEVISAVAEGRTVRLPPK